LEQGSLLPVIEVHEVTRRYGARLALDRVTFEAGECEVIGLLGPNGAGKSTLMRILAGYMPPDSGTVRILGKDITSERLLVQRQVGYMPELVATYPDMTVAGYLRFWARLRGVKNVRASVAEALERVGLSGRDRQRARHLSKGLRQRLGFAQAIVHDPRIIILDEPTIGIDPQQVIEMRTLVRQLGQTRTVLLSSHILSEVEQVSDRVIVLDQGRLVASGPPDILADVLIGEEGYYVEVGGGSPKQVEGSLRKLEGHWQVRRHGQGLIVRGDKLDTFPATIMATAIEQGWTIVELRHISPSLEDTFLGLLKREG
jgi:ABC-2 type transport system ATP-binding protein